MEKDGGTFLDKTHATEILGVATDFATKGPKDAWDRLFGRDSETGAPEGVFAVMKDRILAMLALRVQKSLRLYRPRLA